jgi:hypothetical protein
MLKALRTAWRNATTERDNSTTCPVRIGAVATAGVYHVAAVWMVIGQSTHLDIATLGAYVQHMCTLIGVTGGAIGAKSLMKADAPCSI